MFLVVLSGVLTTITCQELLKNPGFENSNFHGNWDKPNGWGFKVDSVSSDVHSGNKALRITDRKHVYEGPGQMVPLHQGERYTFQAWVKLLNDQPGTTSQSLDVEVAYTWPDGSDTYYELIAYQPFFTSRSGWTMVNGDFMAPSKPFSTARLYFQGPAPGVGFLIDDASLKHVPKLEPSRTEQDKLIDRYRKTNLDISVSVPQSLDLHGITIHVDQDTHLFGFGSLVEPHFIVNPDYKQYQKIFYHMFNWATVGSFKWKYNRGTKNNPNYSDAVNAVNEVRRNGLKVRGHNMFWDIRGYSPQWAEVLHGSQFKSAVENRIKYMTGFTKGRLDHWDVVNEALHGQLYEDLSGDSNYTEHIYNMVHDADPHPDLMLNDFGIVSNGAATHAYLGQARKFLQDGVSLSGLGIQSHFSGDRPPDTTLITRRLNVLSTAKLPLWVTELDINNDNETQRADWYETLLRAYFSHPAVEGVIFWGFWDITTGNHKSALVNGYHYYVNAAGQRYLDLVKKEWSTHISVPLSKGTSLSRRVFQGDYVITITNKGQLMYFQRVSVGKTPVQVNVNLKNIHLVPVSSTANPFTFITHPVHIRHGQHQVIGHEKSGTHTSGLTCVSRWSAPSEVGDDKSVSVGCQGDEVLTGCSSVLKTNQWYRDGERLQMVGGRMVCTAVNGRLSTGPIQAVARCCKTKGLQCEYRQSVQSMATLDGQSETVCSKNYLPVGCSSYTWDSMMDGGYPDMIRQRCIAENDGVNVGTWSYGICCHAPEMTCNVKRSGDNDPLRGNYTGVMCDQGEITMACSSFSRDARSAGSYVGGGYCIAVNGENRFPGEEGVVAMATCCKLNTKSSPIIG